MSKLTVVMYHYIRNLKETRYPEIKGLDISGFEEQIIYLKKYYNIVEMEQVIEAIEGRKKLPEKALLLTFDDGYKDHYTYAFPVMVKHKVKGAFYIPVKSFKEKKVLDVNKIHFILASVEDKNEIVNDLFEAIDYYKEKYDLNLKEEYYKKLAIASRFDTKEVIFIKRLLQVELPEKLRNIIVNNLFEKYIKVDEIAFWEELYLTKNQILVMKEYGMHFGSHSYDHYWLNSLSKKEQKDQIKLSLEGLKELGIDTENWTMCYPYGAYNKDTLEVLKELNCNLAVTTNVKIDDISIDKRYEISRLDTNDLPKKSDAKTEEWYELG